MRAAAILIGLAGAAVLIAVATPLGDQPLPQPLAQDISRLETLLSARLSTGLEGFKSPPGAPALKPDRALPLDRYVRRYALVTLRSEEDLPFTTIDDLSDNPADYPAGFLGQRIVGVLTTPGLVGQPPGVKIGRREDLPEIFHGGCAVVNVVYDPRSKRLISAWCNVPNL